MNNQYKQLLTCLVFFTLISFNSFAGGEDNVPTENSLNALIGRTVKITHVDFKGLDLPASTHFDIEFTDNQHCLILVNGKKHEGTWRYNNRSNTIDITDAVLGSIKKFTYEKSGNQISVLQRVNEEQMHRMIVSVLR